MQRTASRRRTILKWVAVCFAVSILAAAGVAWWDVRYERRMLSEIREVGSYNDSAQLNNGWRSQLRRWQGNEGSSRSLRLSGDEVDDAWLLRWNYLQRLSPTHLDLWNTRITGDGLAALLLANPRIFSLDMRGGDISNATVDVISRHPNLGFVDLRGTNLNDERLASIGLGRFTELSVAETLVTPTGLRRQLEECRDPGGIGLDGRQCTAEVIESLAKLGRRRRIDLVGPLVTDDHLARIEVLEPSELKLVGTSVTNEALERFRKTHPECIVSEFKEY